MQAAREAAGDQHYPQAALYLVATPIGNLADISLRALHVLSLVDTIACEDTRHTGALLQGWGLERARASTSPWLAVHQHNEAAAAHAVLERLASGQRVAYVSDAGTPAISDPGARLVAAVRAGGFAVLPVPGASSVTAALSVAGIHEGGGGFVFQGFLPTRTSERAAAVQALSDEPRAVVLFEAPHRIAALADALQALGARQLTVARELTKRFEQIDTLAANALPSWLHADLQRLRGEFVLVLHPSPAAAPADGDERVLRVLLAELPVALTVKLAVELTGGKRNDLYQKALELKQLQESR